jgi:hypothetical protein
MKWAPWLFGSLTALMIAGCGGERRDDTGAAGGAGTETGTMGEATDTTTPPATDTTRPGGAADTAGDTARKTADTAGGTSY